MEIMDVHRVRFVELEPKAIHCLAFSSCDERPRLAVSRSDASIELWRQCEGRELRHELTIPGRSDSSVEAMVWSGERLFSTGLTGKEEWEENDALSSSLFSYTLSAVAELMA